MADEKTQFIKLSKPPFWNHYVSHILTLNQAELLVIISDDNALLIEIWIYNICNDNYTNLNEIIVNYTSITEIIINYTASLNDNKSFLYLFGYSGRIIKLNLKTKQFEIANKSYHYGNGSRSLFINGQFHIFGGWNEKDKYHFIWNENKKK
eukprot:525609_1